MFCEVHFLSAPSKAIILPSTAVMQEQDNDYILVEISKGKYIRCKVETESVHPDSVRVISGISVGENAVIKGSVYLNP
jgi:cobalt-zinc-cadmium efflux system membrane fusion protein